MSEQNPYAVEITTAADPPKKILLDGAEYDLYGLAHLSKEKENKATALFARHEHLTDLLISARSDADAEKFASSMRDIRIELITTLTSIPADVAGPLNLSAQKQLVEALQVEMAGKGADPAPTS